MKRIPFLFAVAPLVLPAYQYALVRGLSDAFENSLKLNPPAIPIDFNLAKRQHGDYIALLEKLIPTVILSKTQQLLLAILR